MFDIIKAYILHMFDSISTIQFMKFVQIENFQEVIKSIISSKTKVRAWFMIY